MTIKTTTKTATKSAPKRRIKTANAKATKAAPAPKVNDHLASGVDATRYAGVSSMLNANRKTKIALVGERPTSTMSDRMRTSLYALRDAYGGKKFTARGFDNGIMRDLAAMGLIKLTGGTKEDMSGKTYLVDGDSPVKVNLTTAGQTYGKAAA